MNPAKGSQDEDRQVLQRGDDPERRPGLGQLEHQPGLRNRLHERARGRDDLADVVKAIIADSEGGESIPSKTVDIGRDICHPRNYTIT